MPYESHYGEDYNPKTGEGTNYLKPFLTDVGKAVGAVRNFITGRKAKAPKAPDAGMQLMGNPPEKKMRDRSTAGSPPFTDAELKQGYRKMGKGLGK
jgi:hypothetical protein